MPLRAPVRSSVIADVLAQLEGMVASGEWPVGHRIPPEPELVASLGVGRNSVREAVRALSHTGVLEARQGDGTYVRASSGLGAALEHYLLRARARDVLEARRGLEREAARLAAGRRTDGDLVAIDEIVAAQREAVAAGDRDAFVRHDVALHRAIAVAARNAVLVDLLEHLGDALADGITAVLDGVASGDEVLLAVHVHDDLVEAVRSGDPAVAATAADDLISGLVAVLDDGGAR